MDCLHLGGQRVDALSADQVAKEVHKRAAKGALGEDIAAPHTGCRQVDGHVKLRKLMPRMGPSTFPTSPGR